MNEAHKGRVFDAIVDHLVETFSDAGATGIEIRESQARLIAAGVMRRLDGQDDEKRTVLESPDGP